MMGDSFYYSLGRAEILLIGRRKRWVIPGWFLLLLTRQGRVGGETMGDSWVIPTTIPALPCIVVGSTHWVEIQTILSTFLGSTQEAPMGDFWVIPSVTSLSERSVPWYIKHCKPIFRSNPCLSWNNHCENDQKCWLCVSLSSSKVAVSASLAYCTDGALPWCVCHKS